MAFAVIDIHFLWFWIGTGLHIARCDNCSKIVLCGVNQPLKVLVRSGCYFFELQDQSAVNDKLVILSLIDRGVRADVILNVDILGSGRNLELRRECQTVVPIKIPDRQRQGRTPLAVSA